MALAHLTRLTFSLGLFGPGLSGPCLFGFGPARIVCVAYVHDCAYAFVYGYAHVYVYVYVFLVWAVGQTLLILLTFCPFSWAPFWRLRGSGLITLGTILGRLGCHFGCHVVATGL